MIVNVPLTVIRRHQGSAPVDLRPIASELEGHIFAGDLGTDRLDAILKLPFAGIPGAPSQWRIYVDAELPGDQQRVVAAQMLAHWILHRDHVLEGSVVALTKDYTSTHFTDKQVAEAFGLAGSILVPPHLLKDALAFGLKTEFALADHFWVPVEFMSFHLKFWQVARLPESIPAWVSTP